MSFFLLFCPCRKRLQAGWGQLKYKSRRNSGSLSSFSDFSGTKKKRRGRITNFQSTKAHACVRKQVLVLIGQVSPSSWPIPGRKPEIATKDGWWRLLFLYSFFLKSFSCHLSALNGQPSSMDFLANSSAPKFQLQPQCSLQKEMSPFCLSFPVVLHIQNSRVWLGLLNFDQSWDNKSKRLPTAREEFALKKTPDFSHTLGFIWRAAWTVRHNHQHKQDPKYIWQAKEPLCSRMTMVLHLDLLSKHFHSTPFQSQHATFETPAPLSSWAY